MEAPRGRTVFVYYNSDNAGNTVGTLLCSFGCQCFELLHSVDMRGSEVASLRCGVRGAVWVMEGHLGKAEDCVACAVALVAACGQ